MEITRHPAGRQLRLTLKGRLDGTWSEHTTDALTATLEEGWHHLRLDLSGVSFLSSAGIRTLMMHYKKLTSLKGSFAIMNPSQPVLDVLTLAGLHTLLSEPSTPEETPVAARPFEGGFVEVHPLSPGATLHAALLQPGTPLTFTADTLGLGLGALGSEPGQPGEFLAMGGTALAQPANGQLATDYTLTQGALRPIIHPSSGIAAQGGFSHCLRFESADPRHGLPLSTLLALALEETGANAVGLAFAAETEYLVGAALMSSEARLTPLPFPEVRDQMLFTAEPGWPRSVSLGVAFATREAGHPLSSQLRPLGDLFVHAHAAAFPYRPLPKDDLTPEGIASALPESERPLGLLHLLNDCRPDGLGESRFHRGALWVAPLETTPHLPS